MKFFGFGSEKPKSTPVPEERMKMATRGNDGRKTPMIPVPVEVSKSETVVAGESEKLAQVFDGLEDESLKESINQHAISLISGEAQDHVQRAKLEARSREEGIDAETLGKLIELQKNRLNQG